MEFGLDINPGKARNHSVLRCSSSYRRDEAEAAPTTDRSAAYLIGLKYVSILSRRVPASATNGKKSFIVQIGKRKLQQFGTCSNGINIHMLFREEDEE